MYQVEGYAFETKEQEHTAKHEVEIIVGKQNSELLKR